MKSNLLTTSFNASGFPSFPSLLKFDSVFEFFFIKFAKRPPRGVDP